MAAAGGCTAHYEYRAASLDEARAAVNQGIPPVRVAVAAISLEEGTPVQLRYARIVWPSPSQAQRPDARLVAHGRGSRASRACGWAMLSAGLLHATVAGALIGYDQTHLSPDDTGLGSTTIPAIPIAVVGGILLSGALGCLVDGYARAVDVPAGRAGWRYVGQAP